jgi:hypothetical protein
VASRQGAKGQPDKALGQILREPEAVHGGYHRSPRPRWPLPIERHDANFTATTVDEEIPKPDRTAHALAADSRTASRKAVVSHDVFADSAPERRKSPV